MDCWIWAGAQTGWGYGAFAINHKLMGAHRAALILTGIELKPGDWVCHSCDVRLCVRPSHLYVGTPTTNNRDTAARNPSARLRSPETGAHISAALKARYAIKPANSYGARKTQCPKGHPYDEANTARYNGHRYCRTCLRDRANARYWAKKAAAQAG